MRDTTDSPRHRIVEAAVELLEKGGPDAVSTRAVAAAAGMQPPAIYRLFGDKEGLLEAIHRMLCIHLGTPPERFTWQWTDKDKLKAAHHSPEFRKKWPRFGELVKEAEPCLYQVAHVQAA